MKRLPLASKTRAVGELSRAWRRGPSKNPAALVPAKVVTLPVIASTRRITWLPVSAMYRLPLLS